MTPPLPTDRPALHARIEQALRELPLDEADIATIADLMADNPITRQMSPNSTIFDFRSKLNAVVEHFAPHGLTLRHYLQAAVRQPPLFYQSPDTVIANIEGVAAHFAPHGLTLPAYLQAALKQPSLFSRSSSVIRHMESVVEHFQNHGLNTPDYLRAALKQPPLFAMSADTVITNISEVAEHFHEGGLTQADYVRAAGRCPTLFYQSSETIIANVEAMVEHFREHGLTLSAYLHAARRYPQLFYQSPATLIRNIQGVAAHFQEQGLTLSNYLQAALKQPTLFPLSAATVIRHVNHVIDMHRQKLLACPGQDKAPPGQPLRPLFDLLVRTPQYFCLAEDNYRLRLEYVRVTGDRPRGAALLSRPKAQIERALAEYLNKAESKHPSRKESPPAENLNGVTEADHHDSTSR